MGAVVATVIGVLAGGLLLPARHVAEGSIVVRATPEAAWSLVADPARYAMWQRDVRSVDLLDTAPLRWREFSEEGAHAHEATHVHAPHRFVSEVLDDDVQRRPERVFVLEAIAEGTRVTCTESSLHVNPIARFVYRYLLRPEPAIAQRLRDLERALAR